MEKRKARKPSAFPYLVRRELPLPPKEPQPPFPPGEQEHIMSSNRQTSRNCPFLPPAGEGGIRHKADDGRGRT